MTNPILRRILWTGGMLTILGLLLLPASCTTPIGFGPSLDLEGPTISITSQKDSKFVSNVFTLTGVCDDNIQVTGVRLFILSVGGGKVTGVTPPPVQLAADRKNWQVTINQLLPDGEYQFLVYAQDKAGNSSTASLATINLTIDTQSPSTIISLPPPQSRNQLSARISKSLDNMDYLLNGDFQIKGNLDDNYKITEATIDLLDEANNVVFSKTMKDKDFLPGGTPPSGVTGTLYSWNMTIPSSSLTSAGAPLDPAQRAYFKLRVTTKDGVPSTSIYTPATATDLGWLCVWGDADRPWSAVTSVAPNGNVSLGGYISGNAYDDDGVKKVYFRTLKSTDPAPDPAAVGTWTDDAATKVVTLTTIQPRLYPWTVSGPTNAGTYRLYILTEDSNGLRQATFDTLDFKVPDLTAPESRVTSHPDSSVLPSTGTGSFTLSGIAFDNSHVVSFKAAWVPEGQDPDKLSNELLWNNASGPTPYTDPSTIRIWDLTSKLDGVEVFDPALPYNDGNPATGLTKQTWTHSFNVETDFKVGSNVIYGNHVLYFYTKDDSGQFTVNRFTTVKPTTPPVLGINSPSDGVRLETRTAPLILSGTYMVNGGTDNLLDKVTVRWTGAPDPATSTITAVASGGTWSANTASFNLPSGLQNFEIVITDKVGNRTYGSRYVQIDNIDPVLTDVTSVSGNYIAGKTVKIIVDFSEAILVTGNPRLNLNTTPSRYASYTGKVAGSDTRLEFQYVVQTGDTADPLDVSSFDFSAGTIKDLVGNAASSTIAPGGQAQPGSSTSLPVNQYVYVDGVPLTMVFNGGSSAALTSSSPLTLTFNKAVTRDIGSITLKKRYKGYPLALTPAQFNNYYYATGAIQPLLDSSYSQVMYRGSPTYLLNYDIDYRPRNTVPGLPTSTEEQLISLFDTLGYNTQVIDIYSSQISLSGDSKTVTVTPQGGFATGVDYYVNISGTAFKDRAGNYLAAIADTDGQFSYSLGFKVGPTAAPVIRVKRTTGSETTQPTQTEVKVNTETVDSAYNLTAPAVVPAKPDVVFTQATGTTSTSPTTFSTYTATVKTGQPFSSFYADTWTIGITNSNQGEIYNITASSNRTDLTKSSDAVEKAYKTVIINSVTGATNYDGTKNGVIWFRGSNNSGGPTTAPGFPLRWEDNQLSYIKLGSTSGASTTLISWEITVPAEFKALWGDKPADWQTKGPSIYSWEGGSNRTVQQGGYLSYTSSSFEGWSAHARPVVEGPPPHTVTMDGLNDFYPTYERFNTTSGGSTYGYVTWDASYVYLGLEHPEISTASSTEWVLIYIGGTQSGTNTTYGGSLTPNMAGLTNFKPSYYVRAKTDGTYYNAQYYNGSAWVYYTSQANWTSSATSGSNLVAGAYGKAGNLMEFRIPRASIGNPSTLKVFMMMLDEGTTKKAFAGVPFNSFVDNTSNAGNMNLQKYYQFDLTSNQAPNVQGLIKP